MKNEVHHRFGDRLREIRERRGITLREVAQKAGVSESLISQIERNRVSPSIDTLLTVSEVLGVDVDYLFRDYRQKRKVSIVRTEDRRRVVMEGVTYTQLSLMPTGSGDHAIEAFMIEIGEGSEQGSREFGHSGKELGYILKGEGELVYGTETHKLKEGDCIAFDSDIPHILKNTGTGTFKALWVISPPKMFFFSE